MVQNVSSSAVELIVEFALRTSEGLCVIETNGRLLYANPAFEASTGYPLEQLLQAPDVLSLVVHPEDLALFKLSLSGYLLGSATAEIEFRTLGPGRGPRWMRARIGARPGFPDHVDRIHILFSDETERKLTETERDHLLGRLTSTLAKLKRLPQWILMCAACKKVCNDKGFWEEIDKFVSLHSDAIFSQVLCPDCVPRPETTSAP